MPIKRKPRNYDLRGNPSIEDGFYRLGKAYLTWMENKGYRTETMRTYREDLSVFIDWCESRNIYRPRDVTPQDAGRYARYTLNRLKGDGQKLAPATQKHYIAIMRRFFSWLARQHYLLYNPASEVNGPSLPQAIPKVVFTAQEAEAVLAMPDIKTPHGLRDRVILEVFYSTGIRRKELVDIQLQDLNYQPGTLLVRDGKGGKMRVVPIAERTQLWLDKYLNDVRPYLVSPYSDDSLFLTIYGEPLLIYTLSGQVTNYINAANIGKSGSCHTFRHTAATLMLENGADIRFIQQFLGHSSVETTEIYTHVSIDKLKKVHAATHPGALLKRWLDEDFDDERED